MIKIISVLFFIFFITSCSSQNKEELKNSQNSLNIEPVTRMIRCTLVQEEMFEEWEIYSGGLQKSLASTREMIKKDNKSKLSKIIKSMWKLQKKDNFGEHVEYIGKWPIEFSKIQEVMNYLLESELNDLGDCAAIPAWNELMHQELIKLNLDENEEMLEFPADETWEYPHNTNWLAYWLLVNIKEK